MRQSVSDVRSSHLDQIDHAVRVLGRSKHRLKVFAAIYHGKKQAKSVNEISSSTGLESKRVLEEGLYLVKNEIVKPLRLAGTTVYEKDPFYSAHKEKILRLVNDPAALARMPTSTRPHVVISKTALVNIPIPRKLVHVRFITIDDIDSFKRVLRLPTRAETYVPRKEARFKHGIALILGERGRFTDWGGEKNDLYTDKVRIKGKRVQAAFAFKGKGTRGVLTPARMGKNGDQIQRLFQTQASVFFIQYWGQIDESVSTQMSAFAMMKSISQGIPIRCGIIDGDDSCRLVRAYSRAFR